MSEKGGFSIASVVMSYFLVAGGIAIGLISLTFIKPKGEGFLYLAMGFGGFVGGFFAGRASRGTTVTEPAIGAVLVILTLVGVFVGTPIGEFFWAIAKAEIGKFVAIAGVSAAIGAVGGAMVGEKVFTGHSNSAPVWLLFVAMSVLGACTVGLLAMLGAVVRGHGSDSVQASTWFIAMAIGCLLSGIASGASAPKRILLVNLLGAVVGVMGFYLLVRALPGATSKGEEGKAAAGFAIIGVGGGIIAMIGALIGWKAVGKKHATG